MIHYLHYSDESKEKFRIVFWCFSAIKNIVALLFFCNFPVKSTCWGIVPIVCLDKSINTSL